MLLEFLRSIGRNLDLAAPKPPGFRLTDVPQLAMQDGSLEVRTSAEEHSLFRHRKQMHSNENDIFDGSELAVSVDAEVIRPQPSRALSALLQYDQARAAVVSCFYDHRTASASLVEALKPLSAVARGDNRYFMYPGVTLGAAGGCGECGKHY